MREIIKKTKSKSYFQQFHRDSKTAERIFGEKPHRLGRDKRYGDQIVIPVVVLQLAEIIDGWLLAEIIDLKDFNY